jgi:predicted phosphate transport protein (TIGR00153 family)
MGRFSEIFASKDRAYFDLFEEAADNVKHAAELLDRLLRDYPENKELRKEIAEAESNGDRITHDLINRLNHSFVTPIDREDIIQLASSMDDIVDLIEEVSDYLGIYQIEAPMEQAQQLASILSAAAIEIATAMPRLRDFKDLDRYTDKIHELEHEGDRVVRTGLKALFQGGIDPMVVIRWKDLFDRLEEAIDACESVANVINGIVIKNR